MTHVSIPKHFPSHHFRSKNAILKALTFDSLQSSYNSLLSEALKRGFAGSPSSPFTVPPASDFGDYDDMRGKKKPVYKYKSNLGWRRRGPPGGGRIFPPPPQQGRRRKRVIPP